MSESTVSNNEQSQSEPTSVLEVDSVDTNDEFKSVVEFIDDKEHGSVIGNCKWFNKKLGYGFITVYTGEHKGTNIFAHHSGIKPLNSNFRTLKKGEYVHFNIGEGKNGTQAVDITGINGGPLMCDNISYKSSKYATNNKYKNT